MHDLILTDLLNAYIQSPNDPSINFMLGITYYSIGQTAAAVSFYIRTAERTLDDSLKYESLIRASLCFESQGSRSLSVRGLLQHAISIMPKRPEAYYFLSRYYEREALKDPNNVEGWFNAYTYSSIALEVCNFELPPLQYDVDYPGKYGLIFEKAVSSWWCGLCEESRNLFKDLIKNYDIDDVHRAAILQNLRVFGELETKQISNYTKDQHHTLKFKFKNSETVEQNFSESYQDLFVLAALNGKKNGTYLEIGSGWPVYGNNTYLLEKDFSWSGISLDIAENFVKMFNDERKNKCVLKDATIVDYEKFLTGLDFPAHIDYLQLDCDPPAITYQILQSIPFETRKFAVITYEHDYYCDETKSYREKSRKLLEAYGYKLIANNIAPDDWRMYEDWWVHPDLVNSKTIDKLLSIVDGVQPAAQYMLNIDV